MTADTPTDRFLIGILAIIKEKPSSEIIQKAKSCLLDYIGVTLAGTTVTYEKLDRLRIYLGDQGADGYAIGMNSEVSLQTSIFLNGINSHVLELDDGSRYGVTHPGGPLFSALIPIAFKYNIEWNDFLMGILTGYETILRLSTSIQPGHYNKGFHPTATCTPPGIAVGICVMLGLSYRTLKDAFSYACISAGGSLKAIENTSRMKALNAARAAELGFTSYCVARAGFTGPEDVLSGSAGFPNIMSSTYKEEVLFRQETDPLWIQRVYCKLYASCRHTHGAIEGILKLKEDFDLGIDDIEKIEIRIYKGIKGKHDIFQIYGEESAKMSIPYSVAATFLYGNANDEVFKPDYIENPSIDRLMNAISIIEDDHISSLLPNQRATETTVYLKDGKKHTRFIDYPIGEPENPVGYEDLKRKFSHLVERAGRPKEYAEEIISVIFRNAPDLKKLNKLLYNSEND